MERRTEQDASQSICMLMSSDSSSSSLHTSAGIFSLFIFRDCRLEQAGPRLGQALKVARHLVLANVNSTNHIRRQADLVYRLVFAFLLLPTKYFLAQSLHVFTANSITCTLIRLLIARRYSRDDIQQIYGTVKVSATGKNDNKNYEIEN